MILTWTSLQLHSQQKRDRLAAEAKAAKDAEARAKKDSQATWAKNQEKKKGKKPGEELELEGVGEEDIDPEREARKDLRAAAMGQGDEKLFEKKMTKEEKKAATEAKRAEKAAAKVDLLPCSSWRPQTTPIFPTTFGSIYFVD